MVDATANDISWQSVNIGVDVSWFWTIANKHFTRNSHLIADCLYLTCSLSELRHVRELATQRASIWAKLCQIVSYSWDLKKSCNIGAFTLCRFVLWQKNQWPLLGFAMLARFIGSWPKGMLCLYCVATCFWPFTTSDVSRGSLRRQLHHCLGSFLHRPRGRGPISQDSAQIFRPSI